MFLESSKYKEYYLRKGIDGKLEMFRKGKEDPLKPLENYKRNIKYALYHNGKKEIVSMVEFLRTCPDLLLSDTSTA